MAKPLTGLSDQPGTSTGRASSSQPNVQARIRDQSARYLAYYRAIKSNGE